MLLAATTVFAMTAAERLGMPWWRPAALVATWFGCGLLPLVPGTWTSLAALPFAWAIVYAAGPVWLSGRHSAINVFILSETTKEAAPLVRPVG